jgi:hypothetical protein
MLPSWPMPRPLQALYQFLSPATSFAGYGRLHPVSPKTPCSRITATQAHPWGVADFVAVLSKDFMQVDAKILIVQPRPFVFVLSNGHALMLPCSLQKQASDCVLLILCRLPFEQQDPTTKRRSSAPPLRASPSKLRSHSLRRNAQLRHFRQDRRSSTSALRR